LEQKWEWVRRTMQPGMSVSLVAREAGIAASQLFQWRKAYSEGSLVAAGANEPMLPASELQEAMKRIRQLEAALGRKTLENEIGNVAVDYGPTALAGDRPAVEEPGARPRNCTRVAHRLQGRKQL
jgi:transposase